MVVGSADKLDWHLRQARSRRVEQETAARRASIEDVRMRELYPPDREWVRGKEDETVHTGW